MSNCGGRPPPRGQNYVRCGPPQTVPSPSLATARDRRGHQVVPHPPSRAPLQGPSWWPPTTRCMPGTCPTSWRRSPPPRTALWPLPLPPWRQRGDRHRLDRHLKGAIRPSATSPGGLPGFSGPQHLSAPATTLLHIVVVPHPGSHATHWHTVASLSLICLMDHTAARQHTIHSNRSI